MTKTLHLLVHGNRLADDPESAEDFMQDDYPLFWDDSEDTFKTLGLYSSRQRAEEVIEKMRPLPGFRLAPDGFFIHEYVVDETHWPTGFATTDASPSAPEGPPCPGTPSLSVPSDKNAG